MNILSRYKGNDRNNVIKKRILGVILSIVLCITSIPCFAATGNAKESEIDFSSVSVYLNDNVNTRDYFEGGRWSSVVNSYLFADHTRYQRVYAQWDGTVYAECYDMSFDFVSQKRIEAELPIFGGFYAGKDAYYLVWGQENRSANDETEVIRVVKYDMNWNRIQSVSLYGANTCIPFDAGSLRMAECDGYLYIRTCHEMYNGHQANMSIGIKEEGMKITDFYCGVGGGGYVSHSFNQYIIIDDESNIVTLDHGDGFPRAAVLGKFNTKAGEGNKRLSDMIEVLSYKGEIGNNYTGATVGGLEYSSSSYLTAGSSIEQSEASDSLVRNIYVTATDRKNFSTDATSVNWITEYTDNGTISASAPQLVKLDTDSFLLLWSQLKKGTTSLCNGKISYVFLDGNGNQTSDIYTADGCLSDCKPIVSDGKAVWYVSNENQLIFYTITESGGLSSSQATFPSSVSIYPRWSIQDCKIIFTKIGDIPETEYEKYLAVVNREGKLLIRDEDYSFERASTWAPVILYGADNNIINWIYCILVGREKYSGSQETVINPIRQKPVLNKATRFSYGIQLMWKRESGAVGYYIFRQSGDGKYINVKKIKNNITTDWLDSSVSEDTDYTYYIKAYTTDGIQEIYSEQSNTKKISAEPQDDEQSDTEKQPTKTSAVKKKVTKPARIRITKIKKRPYGDVVVKFSKASGADGYEIQYSRKRNFSKKKKVDLLRRRPTTLPLSSGKKYFIRARAYKYVWKQESLVRVNGKWSPVKKVKTKK